MTPEPTLTVGDAPRPLPTRALLEYAAHCQHIEAEVEAAAARMRGLHNLQDTLQRVTRDRDRLAGRVAELEGVSKAKDDHIEARAAERDYYAHRVEELTVALRTVLDNVLIPGRAGVVAPDDYNAARAVLDAVQAPGHVPPCSHAARVAELEAELAEANRGLAAVKAQPDPIDLVHQLHTALHGEASPARPVPPRQVWAELLTEVGLLRGQLAVRDTAIIADAVTVNGLERERDRALSVLRALTDADEPFVTGAADDSSGQTMAAESARAVAWRAAHDHLVAAIMQGTNGEQTDDGHGAVLITRNHLALLVGVLTESDAPAFSPEVRAAVNAAEAALQVADGRATQVVEVGEAL